MTESKKIFNSGIIKSSRFTFMPVSAQVLYFHLGIHSDNNNFNSEPFDICRRVGSNNEDLRLLIKSGYVEVSDDCDGVFVVGVEEVQK